MHIIQYLLNLPFKNNLYKGEGNLVVLAEADVKLVLYHFKSILKFKPNDIGYDINGTEWKIISVYYDNNSYAYEAFNGTKVVIFDNFDLYNASEINDIYQNNLDSKIESIVNKIKQIESCVPNADLIKSTAHENYISFDLYNPSEANNVYQNNLDSKIESIVNKIKQIESCVPNADLVKSTVHENYISFDLYNPSEANNVYQNNLDSKIESIVNKIKQIESCVPNADLVNKNSNKKDLTAKNKKRMNNKKIKEIDNQKNTEVKITKPENKKIIKDDIIIDKNKHEWSVVEIFEFNKKIKYKAVRKNTTKIFNEKDIKKKIN